MKYKIILSITVLLLTMNFVNAQSSKLKFHSINNIGLLEGGSDENLQLQTINGVSHKGFFGGVGIGLDNYYRKSIPLFADLRQNFSQRKSTPFLYLDLGAVFPWDRNTGTRWSSSQYKTGFLYDAGIGYSFPIKGRFAMNLSAGYSQRFLKEINETSRWYFLTDNMPFAPAPSKDTAHYKYNFNRFSFKIGFSF